MKSVQPALVEGFGNLVRWVDEWPPGRRYSGR